MTGAVTGHMPLGEPSSAGRRVPTAASRPRMPRSPAARCPVALFLDELAGVVALTSLSPSNKTAHRYESTLQALFTCTPFGRNGRDQRVVLRRGPRMMLRWPPIHRGEGLRGGGGGGGMTSGCEMTRMIPTSRQTLSVRHQREPSVAWRSPHVRGYCMFLGRVGVRSARGHVPNQPVRTPEERPQNQLR